MLEALKIRDFRFLWSGRAVSQLGSWLLVIAIPAHVLALTGSLLATGLTMVAEYLPPLVVGPIAGVLTDRWDRRRVMLAADAFRAVAVALMLFGTTAQSVWLIYAALIAESLGTVLFRPAAQANTPAIVGTGSALSSAVSLNGFTDGVVRLVGPPLGAALLTLTNFQTLILIDTASYLVSAVAILMTSRRPAVQREPGSTALGVFEDMVAGLRVLRGVPIALMLLPLTTVFLTANAGLSAILVPFGVRQLGGSEQIGLVVSALGIGFLIGAVLIRRLVDRVQPRYLLAAVQLATAAAFFMLFTSTSLVVALPAAVLIGTFGSMTLVTPQTALQRVVPNEVLGRISSVFFAAEALATLIGALVGPLLASSFSIYTTMVIAVIVTALGALVGLPLVPVLPELLPKKQPADTQPTGSNVTGTE